jgi:hypothetical protein
MDDQNIPAPAPSPISIDSLICTVNVPAWNIQSGVMELTERGEDDADYANAVDLTQQTIADGFGEEQVPSLDQIATSYLPRKKFYVEVHNPKLNTGDTITLTTRKYDGSQETQSYSLGQVDSLRFRTQQPLLFFDGPAFDPGTYQTESAPRAKAAAPLAAQAPTIPGSTTLEAQTAHVEVTDPQGRTLKADGNCITYAAIGDSMTMGCLGGNTRAEGQRASNPKQLGNMLGLTMLLPELTGKGIPGYIMPNAQRDTMVMYNPLMFLTRHKGHRANPNAVPNNLAITGADIRSITEDTVMCEDPSPLDNYIFWAGSGEDTRRAVVITNDTPKAPPDWLSSMATLPQLVTVAAGANDALGVVIGNKGGQIFEKDAWSCLEAPDPGHARNLSTLDTFSAEYSNLIAKIESQYQNKGITPSLIFVTIPDVTVIPCSEPIMQGCAVTPFANSGFKASIKFGRNIELDDYFRRATFDTSQLTKVRDGSCGRLGLIPLIKKAVVNPEHFFRPVDAAEKALGTPAKSCKLTDDQVLDPDELDQVSNRVRNFQKAILALLYGVNADPTITKWRKQGKVHVFDLNYLLYCLRSRHDLALGEEPDGYSIETLGQELYAVGIVDADGLAAIKNDKAITRRYYDEVAVKTPLRAWGQAGLIGPDYIHPTPSGHALIACGYLSLMASAAQGQADGFGGYNAETLACKYQNAQIALWDMIANDDWVKKKKTRPTLTKCP